MFEGDSDIAVARHEVGHAVVAVLVGGSFTRVVMEPAQHGQIRSRARVEGVGAPSDFDRATISLAGMFAADTRDGYVNANGASHDIGAACRFGHPEWLNSDDPNAPAGRAKELVNSHREVIDELAEHLLNVGEMSFGEVQGRLAVES